MTTRTVNIALVEAAPQARTLKFKPHQPTSLTDGSVLLQQEYSVTTNSSGVGSIALPVRTTGSMRWDVEIPKVGGKWIGHFIMAAGSAVTLDDLLAAGGSATDSVIDYIDTHGTSLSTTALGTVTHGATAKTTPVDADEFGIVDSAASNIWKRITWSNVKSALKTYLDPYFQPLATPLTQISGLSPSNDDILQRKSGAWANRTPAQVVVDLGLGDAMISKGSINCSANPSYPAANAGDTYKVSVAGKIGGSLGRLVDVDDEIVCDVDGSSAGSHGTVGANWHITQGKISGLSGTNTGDQYTARVNIRRALGSAIKCETHPLERLASPFTMSDGRMDLQAVWLEVAGTITGVKWWQAVAGNFTADNNNKVGLYTYNGSGTLTLVASSTDDGNIWKAGTQSFASKAFSSTYSANPGLYFIGVLYNSSAQTTAPQLVAGQSAYVASGGSADYTNAAKAMGFVTGLNDLPSTQLMSGVGVLGIPIYLALY